MYKEKFLLMNEAGDDVPGGGAPDPTPAPTPEPSFRDNISKAGETNPFIDTIPEEFRSDASLKDIKSMEGLVKGFINSQKMIGDRIVIPGEDATDEQWGGFYDKIGRPKDFNDYDLAVNEELELSEERLLKMKEMMFKAGLNPRQAKTLTEMYFGDLTDERAGLEAKRLEMDKNFDETAHQIFGGPEKYASIKGRVEEYINTNVPEDIRIKMGALDNNALLSVMYSINAAMNTAKTEDQPISSDETPKQGPDTKESLRLEYTQLYTDYRKADPRSKEAAELKEKMQANAKKRSLL